VSYVILVRTPDGIIFIANEQNNAALEAPTREEAQLVADATPTCGYPYVIVEVPCTP